MKTKNKKVFYGWWIVLGCFFLSGGGVGILINTMGTFIKPVSDAMGFTRAQFSLVTSLSNLAGMIVYPLWGSYMKRHSVRKAMLSTGFLIPLVLLGFSFCNKLWQFYLCAVLIGLMTGSISTLPITTVINKWFEDSRGTATGLGSCGSGLAMVIVPLVSFIIVRQGWRMAYRAVGLIYFLIIVPIVYFVIRDNPADKNLSPYRKEGSAKNDAPAAVWGLTKAEALGTSCFRLFLIIAVLSGTINTFIINHTYAFLTDISVPAATASRMVSLQMFILMLSKFSLGVVFDKLGLKFGFLLSVFAYTCAGICLFLAPGYIFLAYLALIASGIGSALPAMSMAYANRVIFGNKDYSSTCGVMLSLVFLGNSIGTAVNGFIYDITGSYQLGWVAVIVMSVVMCVLFLLVLKTSKTLNLMKQTP